MKQFPFLDLYCKTKCLFCMSVPCLKLILNFLTDGENYLGSRKLPDFLKKIRSMFDWTPEETCLFALQELPNTYPLVIRTSPIADKVPELERYLAYIFTKCVNVISLCAYMPEIS